MPQFGSFAAQELAPRRRVVEELADLDARARRAGRRPLRLPAPPLAPRALRCARRALRRRCARRCSPTRLRRWLASASPRKPSVATVSRSCRLAILLVACRCNAMANWSGAMPPAVVADHDAAHAAALQPHLDARRAGVQRVFQQLLDHRRRALDHLASGDLADQHVGQPADLCRRRTRQRRPKRGPIGHRLVQVDRNLGLRILRGAGASVASDMDSLYGPGRRPPCGLPADDAVVE